MRGTPWKFTIRAKYKDLLLCMDNTDSRNAIRGSTIGLGMISNRKSYMVLAGEGGDWNFFSVGDVSAWMQVNLDKWQNRSLRQLCVPASHDSGMSLVTSKTRLAAATSIITQYNSIFDQLGNGVRYFDLRPVYHNGRWVSGHYTFVDQSLVSSWQGGDGEPIDHIIDQINRFTSDHRELIVLSVSHVQIVEGYNKNDFHNPTPGEWNDLLGQFEGLKYRWSKSTEDLTRVPLKDFIGPFGGTAQAAVVLLFDNEADLTNRAGMFHYNVWPWDASDWEKPESDRLREFKDKASLADAKPFSYSGCHTQTTEEAVLCTLGQDSRSILNLSENPKNKLFTELFPACTETMHPCAISMDAIDSSDLTALCLAITERSRHQG